ncbi:MAG: hypothetical protein EA001_05290 [Oscillatoriales cyanobacterium]|nr:MAG: hypothetical protein EA001_05290 [Oscillatoriales cyanobacterium]
MGSQSHDLDERPNQGDRPIETSTSYEHTVLIGPHTTKATDRLEGQIGSLVICRDCRDREAVKPDQTAGTPAK